MSVFYDHILPHATARQTLEKFLSDSTEIDHVLRELDELYHYVVLEHILHTIPEHVHGTFIAQLRTNPADHRLLLLLRTYDPTIEQHLIRVTLDSTKKFIDSIHA